MQKYLLIALLSAVAMFASDNTNSISTNAVIEPAEEGVNGGITIYSESFANTNTSGFLINANPEFYSVHLTEQATNVIWKVDSSTNVLNMTLANQVVTNWITIERTTNQPPKLKQIGQVQTNRVLTLLFHGRTNTLILGIIGKEEWPTKNQIINEPKRR